MILLAMRWRKEIKVMVRFKILFFIAVLGVGFNAFALDGNGNFESAQEQDEFIAQALKNMVLEINSQTPIQLDEYTSLTSAVALRKKITFNYLLSRTNYKDVNSLELNEIVMENLNHSACQSKATRALIDLGVVYEYIYFSNDGKQITRVAINSYRC